MAKLELGEQLKMLTYVTVTQEEQITQLFRAA